LIKSDGCPIVPERSQAGHLRLLSYLENTKTMLSIAEYKALVARMPEAAARRILTLPAADLIAMDLSGKDLSGKDPAVYMDAVHRLDRYSTLTAATLAADIPDTVYRMGVLAAERKQSTKKYGAPWCASCGYDYGGLYMICPYRKRGEFLSMKDDTRVGIDGNVYILHTDLWIRRPCAACSPLFMEDFKRELRYRAEDLGYHGWAAEIWEHEKDNW
jgi:hypothetical protein